jgi:hypothetical protein
MTCRKLQLVTALVLAAGCLATARAEEAKNPAAAAAAADERVAKQLDRVVPEIRFNGQRFDDVIDFMRDVTGANIFVHWRALESAGIARNAPVAMQLKDVKFKTALSKLTEAVSTTKGAAQFKVHQGVIVISVAPEAGAEEVELVNGAKLPEKVDRVLPDVHFNGQSFADVIAFLRDVTKANIFVNWNALKEAGIGPDAGVFVMLRNVPMSVVLKHSLQSASDGKTFLKFTFEENVITVTTGRMEKEK